MGEQYFKGVPLTGSIWLQREQGFSRRGLSGGGGGRGVIESFLYKTDVYSPEELYKVVSELSEVIDGSSMDLADLW